MRKNFDQPHGGFEENDMTRTSVGNFRWLICALLFFATTINYLDRAVISLLKSVLSEEFQWDDGDYANIELGFKISYAIGLLLAGSLIDRIGTKIGYAVSIFMWSLAAIGHAWAKGINGFITTRVLLGLSEAGNFPAAIKAVAEWFPKKERALATGIFNSGTNIGAIAAPLTVPFIAVTWGWQWAFIITGALGIIWLALWFIYYEVPKKQRRLSGNEYDYIHSDETREEITAPAIQLSWRQLLGYRQTWAFAIGKLLTDPIWWFYLFWLPDFLESQFNIRGTAIALPMAVVYILSAIGSISGGWLPLHLVRKGRPVFAARKISMLVYALLAVPVYFTQVGGAINLWIAVLIIGLAAAAHQAWSANIFTTVSDIFPKAATGTVTGIGGMFGALGGILFTALVQKNLFVSYRAAGKIEVAYAIMFFICGTVYFFAWLIMHLLVPKMKTINAHE